MLNIDSILTKVTAAYCEARPGNTYLRSEQVIALARVLVDEINHALTPSQPTKTFRERVQEEREQLWDRYEKLEQFIAGNLYQTLPAEECNRLCRQFSAMADYVHVLDERIVNFRRN